MQEKLPGIGVTWSYDGNSCRSHRKALGYKAGTKAFSLSVVLSPAVSDPLTHRSPQPPSETPPPPADPLPWLLLSSLGVTLLSSQPILAPLVYRALLAQGPHF